MKTSLSIVVSVFALSISTPIKAAEVCNTLDDCRLLLKQVKDRIEVLEKRVSERTDESVDANGKRHVFVRDTSNEKLGEAWRDESGMIWGDLVRQKNGSIYINHYEATQYCKSIGATLPEVEDFVRLR